MTYTFKFLYISIFITVLLQISAIAQEQTKVIRISKLVIDSAQLEKYKMALKEHAQIAVLKEVGVLTLYAVYERKNPTHVTVFEIYADTEAYNAHLKTPHFLRYKKETKDMVKSLELIETFPIALESKK